MFQYVYALYYKIFIQTHAQANAFENKQAIAGEEKQSIDYRNDLNNLSHK